MSLSSISPVGLAVTQLQARVRGHQLLEAAGNGDSFKVKLLLARGEDVNATDKYGRTALYIAAKVGKTEVVEELVKAGADVNVTNKYGVTALHNAVGRDHLEIVKLLLVNRANINATDKHGRTALYIAAQAGKTEVVEALVSAGAELNTRDVHGMTALNWAIANGHTKIVETLVKEGAELTTTDVHGITALQIAIFEGHYIHVKNAIEEGKKELIAQLGALEHEHVWGEKSTDKLAALCKENSTKNDHIDVLNKPDLQRYIWGFNNKPSLRLKKARQYSAEAATKIQAGFRGFKGRNIAKEAKEAAATKIQ